MEHDIEIVNRLALPLDPKNVKKHPFTKMDYLEGYHVIDEANEVFGALNWEQKIVQAPTFVQTAPGKGFYQCIVEVTVVYMDDDLGGATTVRRQDIGTCAIAKDSPEGHDTGVKGAVTDAMKRCFRTFGQRFGNVLYDKDAPWKANRSGEAVGKGASEKAKQAAAEPQKPLPPQTEIEDDYIPALQEEKPMLKKELRGHYEVAQAVIDVADNIPDLVQCHKDNYKQLVGIFPEGWMHHIDERYSVNAKRMLLKELNEAESKNDLKNAWKLANMAKPIMNDEDFAEVTVLKDERKGMMA